MGASIIVGGHYGDEGKGKLVSYIAVKDRIDIAARAGVGPNAGHQVFRKGKKFGLRMMPSAFVNPDCRLLIGAGVLVNPDVLLREIEDCGVKDRFGVDKRCPIITQDHIQRDKASKHLTEKVKTTGTGCGPANEDRAKRIIGIARDEPKLKDYLTDTALEVNEAIDAGKKVVVEGSQGFFLSLFYGNLPYVTSKDTSASTAAADVGVGPKKIDDVFVVFKSYASRVGGGPLNTEITEETLDNYPFWKDFYNKVKEGREGSVNEVFADYLNERGTVTGRLRRVGAFDYEGAKYSLMVNGSKTIGLTCLDKLFPETAGVTDYDKLSSESQDYVSDIEKKLGAKAVFISTGPNPEDTIDLR